MLKFLRKKTKVVIWTVLVAFVAWGGYAVSIQFTGAGSTPGKIFGKKVSYREFLLANRAVQIFYPSRQTAEEPPSADEIEARTWEFLILSHEAKQRKIKVSDDEVRAEIAGLLARQGASALTGEQYRQWVQGTLREEPHDFEAQVREYLRIRKLLTEVRRGLVPDADGPEPENALRDWLRELYVRAEPEVYQAGN